MSDIVLKSPSQNLEKIVFFDFDGTLTTRDSLLPFLLFSIGILATVEAFFFSAGMLFAYFLKIISNEDAKSFLLEKAFKGRAINSLNIKGEAFAILIKKKFEKEEMINILKAYKDDGCYCVLVSASLDIYLKYWSENSGVDALLCSALQTNADGVVVGGLQGRNCYGAEKVKRIKTFLETYHVSKDVVTISFGDSQGDDSMLKWCNEGWRVRKTSCENVKVIL